MTVIKMMLITTNNVLQLEIALIIGYYNVSGNEYSLVGLGGCVPFYPVQQKQKYVKVEESSNSRSNITAVDFDDVVSYLDQSDEDIDEVYIYLAYYILHLIIYIYIFELQVQH